MRQLSLFAENNTMIVGEKNSNSTAELRSYQLDVLDRGRERMKAGGRRGIIQGETGSGKSWVIGKMTQLAVAKGTRCLIMADRRRLVQQMSQVLDKFGVPHGVIMSGETRTTYEKVILASRDTLSAWKRKQLELPPPFQLLQIDEAHKAGGDVYQDLLSLWPHAFSIGYTATPVRADGRPLSYYQWIECIAPPSQLIAEGWLLKPEVRWPRELALRRKQGKKISSMAGCPVAHWFQEAEGLPTIAFCEDVKASISLRDKFIREGVNAEHIDSSVSDDGNPSDRDKIFRRIAKGETKVLCSVDLMIEGVDIPELSCAILYRKFGSFGAFRQAAGRIMRPAPWIGKTKAIILDHSGATGEHGPPGEDFDWSNIELSIADRRRKALADEKVRPQIVCTNCYLMFDAAPVCPSCGRKTGRQPSIQSEAKKIRDQLLTPFENESPEEHDARVREASHRVWRQCIYIAIGNNLPVMAAFAMFKKRNGKWPKDAGIGDLPAWEMRKLPASVVFAHMVRKK